MDNNTQNNPYSGQDMWNTQTTNNGQDMYHTQGTYDGQNMYNTQNTYDGQNMYNSQGNMYGNQNMYGQQPYQNGYPMQSPYGGSGIPDPGQGKGIAAMVLGICSIILCWTYGIVGLICGIIGFIMAKQSKEQSGGVQNQFAKAGSICSIIGMVLSALMLLYCIFVVWLFAGVFGLF